MKAFSRLLLLLPHAVALMLPITQQQNVNIHRAERDRTAGPLSRKDIMMLNRRKLRRLSGRSDCEKTVQFLAECYHHLSLSKELLEDITKADAHWSYESLLGILYSDLDQTRYGGDIIIIDGRFLTSILDCLRKSCNSIPIAMHLLNLSVGAAIHNRQVALDTVREITKQDDNELRKMYKAVFSLFSSSNNRSDLRNSRLVLHLFYEHLPSVAQVKPETEVCHAVLNALGRCGESAEVLRLLDAMEQSTNSSSSKSNYNSMVAYFPAVDQMAYQTAISSLLSKRGQIDTALSILHRMKSNDFQPDANCYNAILIGVNRESGRAKGSEKDGELHKVALKILKEMNDQGLQPTEQALNSVIATCGKESAWYEAAKAEKKESHTLSDFSHKCLEAYFKHLECYRKVGKGADSYWEIGHLERENQSTIIVGIQPHRNPTRNGLSLVFYEQTTDFKLGRILLKNTSSKTQKNTGDPTLYSSIVGMEVHRSLRGQGLSKIFLAIWLKICLITSVFPRAAVMNKPLISKVLMQFGFVPQEGGTRCQLVRLDTEQYDRFDNCRESFKPTFGLYSTSKKSLEGMFSTRVLRTQNIALLSHDTSFDRKQGATIYVKTTFEHPVAIADGAVPYKAPPEMDRLHNEENASYRQVLERHLQSVLCDGDLSFFGSKGDLQLAFTKFIAS